MHMHIYIYLHILRNGIYPSMWCENMIMPTYIKEVIPWIPILIKVYQFLYALVSYFINYF